MTKWILGALVLFLTVGIAFAQVNKQTGCIPYTKSDGRQYCDVANLMWDDSNNVIALGGTNVTSTAAELNILDGVTSTAGELNYLDIATLGTGVASKAVVLDSGDDYTWPAAGIFTYGVLKDSAGTTLGATAAELNQHADVSAMSELHVDDDTLTAADCGRTMFIATDAKTFTLPATIAGCELTFVNTGADGAVLLTVSPNASDYIAGTMALAASVVVFEPTDNKDLQNTKTTAITGDSVTIIGDGAAGWFITSSTGIWAQE